MIDMNALTAAVDTVIQEARRIAAASRETIAALPEAPADLRTMLDELADADVECDGHFGRFPKSMHTLKWEDQSEECREDWSRSLRRRDAAMSKITRYAKVTRTPEAKNAVPAVAEPSNVATLDEPGARE